MHTDTRSDATRTDTDLLLIEHARWADLEVLTGAAPLTEAQLDRTFEMGVGTLRHTLTHSIGAASHWLDVYHDRKPSPWLGDQGPFSIHQLREITNTTYDSWADAIQRLDRTTILVHLRDGKRETMGRAEILAHVFTHAAHHRAQAINMLRQLAVNPLPTGGLARWVSLNHPPT